MFERFFAAEKNKNPEPSNTWLWTGKMLPGAMILFVLAALSQN